MVIKFPNGAIKIFEANADEGVQLYNWDDFHIQFSNYEKVCYRKLYSINKEELHPILMTFMKKMIGKNYSFGALKLLRRNSSEEAVELQSDFFCSELMAKAYKYIGILDNSKGSNRFWPVDFTDRGSIPFIGANYLGFEKLIILKRHIKLF